MDRLPVELVNHCIYFTDNPVAELSLVNKYFNNNVKGIRITSNEDYPAMTDEHLPDLPNLTKLDLKGNQGISDEGVTQLGKLTFLELGFHLNFMRGNTKSIMTDQSLSTLTSLTSLNLNYDKYITDKGISKLVNLVSLSLVENSVRITNEGISNLTNLQTLQIETNSSFDLSKLSQLTSLSLSDNANVISFRYLVNLRKLRLRYNKIISDEQISALTNLEELDLSFNNKITSIKHFTKLKTLNLFCNDLISDHHISTLTNLEELDLSDNYTITGQALQHLPCLKIVKLCYYQKLNNLNQRIKIVYV